MRIHNVEQRNEYRPIHSRKPLKHLQYSSQLRLFRLPSFGLGGARSSFCWNTQTRIREKVAVSDAQLGYSGTCSSTFYRRAASRPGRSLPNAAVRYWLLVRLLLCPRAASARPLGLLRGSPVRTRQGHETQKGEDQDASLDGTA